MPHTHGDIMPFPFISILVGAAVTRAALLAASTNEPSAISPTCILVGVGAIAGNTLASRRHPRCADWGIMPSPSPPLHSGRGGGYTGVQP